MQQTDRLKELDWKSELKETAFKYHIIGCWAAFIINPLWGIVDYYITPEFWKTFATIRLTVTLLTGLAIFFRKQLKHRPEIIVFIPFLGISFQNAYVYSVMDVAGVQQFTFGYIALFIGAGMLVLWEVTYSIVVILLSLIANIILFNLFSNLAFQEVMINGGFLTTTVAIITVLLIHTRYQSTKKEIIARLALAETNYLLELQKNLVEEKNKSITDSINYAKKIQEAILPPEQGLKSIINDSFILYKPKDIVSGDFYWYGNQGNSLILAAGDCTGHGVPGALMSMLGSSFLNEIVNEKKINQPAKILSEVRDRIIGILKSKDESESKDGMDIAMVNIDVQKSQLQYAGAFNPLWLVREGKVIEVKADKFPIGNYVKDLHSEFTNHFLDLNPGDAVYLFTDGYADQFGGPKGKKFKYKPMKELLLSLQKFSLNDQKEKLADHFDNWKGELEQVDDILVIGLKF